MRRAAVRRVSLLLPALVAALAIPAPAGAEVTTGDIARAEDRVAAAQAALQQAAADLESARRRLDALDESLAVLTERIRDAEVVLAERRDEIAERIVRVYVLAGAGDAGVLWYDDPSRTSTQRAYVGAVTERDVGAITAVAAGRRDLERLAGDVEARRAEQAAVVEELAAEVDRRRDEVAAAGDDVDAVRAEWQRQEEERRRLEEDRLRREEEERRRLEEEERLRREEEQRRQEAAQAAIDDAAAAADALGYDPSAGVEQWRWLVAKHFPERLVDEALRVMACESRGDPFIVNPFSGAAGLFQQMPAYWPTRSANAGWAGASIFHPEANIAASAWLVDASERAGKDSWVHWSCKP